MTTPAHDKVIARLRREAMNAPGPYWSADAILGRLAADLLEAHANTGLGLDEILASAKVLIAVAEFEEAKK